MSGGYADRLKAYPNKGVCGLPEKYDNERRLAASLREVVNAVREAQHLVIFTGAGISTAAGIPDFRGPTGIWTQEKARDKSGIDTLERVTIEYIAMIVSTFELIHKPLRGIISIDLSDHLLRERIGVEGCGAGDADVAKLLNVLANCIGREGMGALTSLNLKTPGASGSFDTN